MRFPIRFLTALLAACAAGVFLEWRLAVALPNEVVGAMFLVGWILLGGARGARFGRG